MRTRAAWAVVLGVVCATGGLDAGPAVARADEPKVEEGKPDPGERYFNRAAFYVRARHYDKALEFFEKALPYRNQTSDIFFNLVVVSEAEKDWARVFKYATGFLFLEAGSKDSEVVEGKLKKATEALARRKIAPVTVSFGVKPKNVTVYLDHVPVTRAGQRPVQLLPGTYEALAELVDHHPWKTKVEIPASDEPFTVKGELVKMIFKGKLKVMTDPAEGVEVFIDDQPVGKTPLEPLTLDTKRYLVRFELPGYDKWHRYVTIDKDETYELRATLERSGAAPD